MAHPLLLVLAGAAGGALVANAVETARQKQIATDLARQQALDLSAKQLEMGRTYSVMLQIDPRHPTFGGLRDPAQAAAMIKGTLESPGGTGGWRLLGNPSPLDADQMAAFQAGKPSTWAFTGVWTRPETFVREKPGWLTMAVPFLVPSS